MTMLFGPVLATALVAQIQGGMIQGKVVDDQGKPVADTQVVWYAVLPTGSSVEPAEVATKMDAAGQFQLALPSLSRAAFFRFWAYRPGSAIALRAGNTPPFDLALRRSQPRTVKVEGPDGRPVLGAGISPQVRSVAGPGGSDDVPEAIAKALAVTAGPDGQATLNYLAGGDQLVAVRLTAPSIGTQDLQVLENPCRNNQGASITIHLKPVRRLAGRPGPEPGRAAGRGPGRRDLVDVPCLGAQVSRRFPGWPRADGGRRHVPDAREPAGRFVVPGSDPRTAVLADPVPMDYDRRAVSARAASASGASARDPRAGRRSSGQAAGQRRSLFR